jgi:hypothetical protein
MKHRRLRRLLFGASLAVAGVGPALVMTAPPAAADNCVQLRVYVNGSITRVGPNCVLDSGDICAGNDPTVGGPSLGATGAGITVCVFVPVMD